MLSLCRYWSLGWIKILGTCSRPRKRRARRARMTPSRKVCSNSGTERLCSWWVAGSVEELATPVDVGIGDPGRWGREGLAAGIGPSVEFISNTNSSQSLALENKKKSWLTGREVMEKWLNTDSPTWQRYSYACSKWRCDSSNFKPPEYRLV